MDHSRPNNTVTYNEAATMIVRALGYTDEALGGTWPTNYVTKAMDKDILKNVTLGQGATRGDIAIMLFNALTLPIGTVNQDGEYVVDANDTLMARVGGDQANDAVILGTEESVINLLPYVGVYSEIFLNDDDEIILVRPIETMLSGDFNAAADEFEASSDYTVSGTATANTKYFVNGEETAAFALADLEDATISAKVSGTTIKEIYAVAKWEITEANLFTDNDADDIAFDQELFGYEFKLDDAEELDTTAFELVGVDSLDEIDEDDVVYVYAGGTDYIRKVAVGQSVVSGEITKINSGSTKFTVNGSTYKKSSAPNNDIATVSVEDDVEIRLDAEGKIYTMETVESATNYAIVLETGDGIGSGLTGSDPVVKLFLVDGSNEIFDVDYDESGVTGLFNAGTKNWDAGEITTANLIEYSVDDDGKINEITVLTTANGSGDITSKGYYDGKAFASTAVVFGYDGGDADKADSYSVIELDDIFGLENVDSDYYTDSFKIEAIIVNDYDSGDDSVFALVNGYAFTVSPDYEVTYYIDGEKVVYGTDLDVSTLVEDKNLYELTFNADGEVKDHTLVAATATTTGATTVDFDGSTLDIDGAKSTVDSGLVIYEVEADGDYAVKTKREFEETAGAKDIKLYDVVDSDSVYDIIVFEVQ